MQKIINLLEKEWKNLQKEIKSQKSIYIILIIVLIVGLFLRVYRTTDLLGFYFDQGRDALVIWRFLYEGKFFLIGPVTGLAGIFLGPLYYYLITPFYFLGKGNPAYPAIFLSLLTVLANLVIFYVGKEMSDRLTGLFAATIASFSYYIILSSRWLSNPTAIFLTSSLLLLSMLKIVQKKDKRWWYGVALFIGLSLQFEAASAVFYIPMILVFAIWQYRRLPSRKDIAISFIILFATFFPQIIFDFRHDHILYKNLHAVLFSQKSFRVSVWNIFSKRVSYLWTVFYSKIIPENKPIGLFFTIPVLYYLFRANNKLKKVIVLLSIFILVPVVGYFAFQGNKGNIYDYYMTGYYLPLILTFSIGLGLIFKKAYFGKIFIAFFFIVFLLTNFGFTKRYLEKNIHLKNNVSLGNELVAADWVFDDNKMGESFNIDVYVPPVIPYSWDYIFLWQGTRKCRDRLCGLEKEKEVSLLYTIYEEDPNHPWRLESWLERQRGIGKVLKEKSFGGITVQRRERL